MDELPGSPQPAPSHRAADLLALARAASAPGPAWAIQSGDLNATLLVFEGGDGVPEHVNDDLDVLIVVLDGRGTLTLDDDTLALHAGQAVLIPRGARRSTRADGGRFAYLTCHRRRPALWPRNVPRP